MRRPSSGDDWSLAYCQAELYVRYMTLTYGKDGPRKMITAYGDHLDTRAALERAFGVSEEKFEQGYREFLKGVVAAAGPVPAVAAAADIPALERDAKANPTDAHRLARLGKAHFDAGRRNEGRDWASKALALDPKEQLAAFVVAQAAVAAGDRTGARDVLRIALDPQNPQIDALVLLSNLTLEAKDYPELEKLATLGEKHFPLEANWAAALTVVYRETGRRELLAQTLARRAEADADDVAIRLELAKLSQNLNDPEGAQRWAMEAIHIDSDNAEAEAVLAQGRATHGKKPGQP